LADIGPSLAKLRRDWRAAGEVVVPTGMIARRVILAAIDKLPAGQSLTVERVGERALRISQHAKA
jgi:hypothetical protein